MSSVLRKAAIFSVLSPFLPLVFLARLLRPLLTIRFGRLRQERIGHLAWNVEYYLCTRNGVHARTLDLFAYSENAANKQLMRMWARLLPMSRLVWPLWKLNSLLPGGAAHEVELPFGLAEYQNARDFAARTPSHLSLTPEEEERGARELRAMGVPEGMPFVCFHSRDAAYLAGRDPSRDWAYHNFRDSSIANFVPAAEELTRRGFAALRMGAVVAAPVGTANPLVIDYATKHRSDFMDMYLTAKCAFFIGGNSGLEDVADILRKPLARTNAVQFFAEFLLFGPKDVFIPKRLRLAKERRFLTLREIAASPVWHATTAEVFRRAGVEVVENTPEEISELAVELSERLRGAWRETPEDAERQRRFWAILEEAGKLSGPPVSRIGAGFLRRHPDFAA